jgi:hypothetical protein
VRKLLGIGTVLALLVTFIVPFIVAAQDQCCGWTPPTAPPLPDRTTKTLAGGVVWTLLGVSDIRGKAICATTGHMAGTLGGWSDELGVEGAEITAVALDGVARLVEVALTSFLNMKDLGKSIGDLLRGVAEVLAGAGA